VHRKLTIGISSTFDWLPIDQPKDIVFDTPICLSRNVSTIWVPHASPRCLWHLPPSISTTKNNLRLIDSLYRRRLSKIMLTEFAGKKSMCNHRFCWMVCKGKSLQNRPHYYRWSYKENPCTIAHIIDDCTRKTLALALTVLTVMQGSLLVFRRRVCKLHSYGATLIHTIDAYAST
jgi:hypothetical protein